MPILTIPSAGPYPPGITGDPYTPDDISKFYDMNWVGNSGLLSTGLTATGLRGLRGLGAWVCTDPSNADTCYDDGTTDPALPPLTPAVCPAGQIDNGGGICIPTTSIPTCPAGQYVTGGSGQYSCTDPSLMLNTPLTPAQAGLTAAQQAALIAAAGNSAVSLIRTAAGGPYTVAGTNLVYNPATGQITTTAAVNATAGVTSLSSITQYLPIGLALVAAMLILPKLLGGK